MNISFPDLAIWQNVKVSGIQKFQFLNDINPIMHGGGAGGIYPPPCRICFNKIFFTESKRQCGKISFKNIDLLTNYDTFVINDWQNQRAFDEIGAL